MASRRLEADRFFTKDFTPEVQRVGHTQLFQCLYVKRCYSLVLPFGRFANCFV